MVITSLNEVLGSLALFWGWSDLPEVPEAELDSSDKTTVLVAIGGLVLLAFLLVLLVLMAWLGSRAVRRYVSRPLKRLSRKSEGSLPTDDWAQRPLVPDLDETSDDDSDETSSQSSDSFPGQ